MSDLLDDSEAVFTAVAHFRKKMHDVIVLHILDPQEIDLSLNQRVRLIDMETEESLELDPAFARVAYREELRRFIDACKDRCAAVGADYRLVSTAEGFDDFLHQYLVERRRMSL